MPIIIPSDCEVHDFYHTLVWINNGILYAQCKQDLVINLQVAKDMVRDRKKVSQGIIRPLLIDVTKLLYIDTPGRNYLSTVGCELVCAGAIYTKNELLVFVGNAFIILDRPTVPTKVFSNEISAIKWLELFKFSN